MMGPRFRIGNSILAGWWAAVGIVLWMGPGEAGAQTQGRPPAANFGERTGVEVPALYGWQFGGSVDLTTGGELELEDADAIGFLLSVPVQTPDTQIELSYSFQGSAVYEQEYWSSQDVYRFDVDVHYFQIGGLRGVAAP